MCVNIHSMVNTQVVRGTLKLHRNTSSCIFSYMCWILWYSVSYKCKNNVHGIYAGNIPIYRCWKYL